jgi:hypothetical protein
MARRRGTRIQSCTAGTVDTKCLGSNMSLPNADWCAKTKWLNIKPPFNDTMKNFKLNLDEHTDKMSTIERGAIMNEKDAQNGDGDVEMARVDNSGASAPGE